MDRRKFFGAFAALTGTAIFPRKSESAQSEGLSHGQMAEVIQNHPFTVFLQGDTHDFGKSARPDGKWHTAMLSNQINPDYICTHTGRPDSISSRRSKIVSGCIIETRFDSSHFDRVSELSFDISNPLLKVIRLLDTPNRYFARLKEKWVEL